MKQFLSLLAGVVFGIGLTLSGMTDPSRVRGFLDLFGDWDPTLAFVMGGAIPVMAVAWLVQARMSKPAADTAFFLPGTTKLDSKLAIGAILFGVGWGLAGLCPGPAITSLATASSITSVGTFVVAMIVGMLLHRLVEDRL
jgi:uncharacterized membrane protein YedE/YeeE